MAEMISSRSRKIGFSTWRAPVDSEEALAVAFFLLKKALFDIQQKRLKKVVFNRVQIRGEKHHITEKQKAQKQDQGE